MCIISKVCTKCGVIKQLGEFYKDSRSSDGCQSRCKKCHDYDCKKCGLVYRNTEHGKLVYRKNISKYKSSNAGVLMMRKARRKYIENNMDKHKAHVAVMIAKRSGKLVPGLCEVCNLRRVESHHEDYKKPLDVQWLCKRHHIEADSVRRGA